MNEVEEILNEYYNNYNEDERLIRDKAHQMEYITTTKYIEKYLKDGNRILEVGAGTGRYSINYAKKGGKIFIAFIPDDAVVLSYGIRGKHIKDLKKVVDKNWKVPKIPKEVFATYRIEELQNIIKKFDVKELELISTDGIAPNMAIYVNELDEEEFELYIDYHLRNCDRKELLGFSSHLLQIVEKL